MRRLRSSAGMTYIQLLMIIVMAGIVGALAVPYYTNQKQEAIREEARQKVIQVAQAQESWYEDHGRFTDSCDSLATQLPETFDFLDPVSGDSLRVELSEEGQAYTISTSGARPIEITTEDRWYEFRAAWESYRDEQSRRADEERRSRGGRE
ncbi:MAG: type IV pilin protein [bacterium]